jgi:hypothetical protein
MFTCSACGAVPDPPDELPLGWMLERDRGRLLAVCTDCVRRHTRAIEAKLDQAWW